MENENKSFAEYCEKLRDDTPHILKAQGVSLKTAGDGYYVIKLDDSRIVEVMYEKRENMSFPELRLVISKI